MDILLKAYEIGWTALSYAVPFLFVLSVVVFVHELGHFLMARWCGVRIEAFSIGFGREIVGWTDSRGTRWKIAWIPLGGYVKFFGDDNAASQPLTEEHLARLTPEERRDSYHAKPVHQRAAIAVAGPVANFLLAMAIFAGLFTIVGRPHTEPLIGDVVPGSAAEAAGFKPGDLVLSIDGYRIDNFNRMQRLVATSNGRTLDVVVRRDGQDLALRATPREDTIEDRQGRKHIVYRLGLQQRLEAGAPILERYDPLTALGLGAAEVWFVMDRTGQFMVDLVAGRARVQDLGGPVRIAEVSGDVAAVSFAALVNLIGILSVTIGLLNLFPIPMLDGGHLLFYAIEALRGRPLSENSQEIGFRIGFAMVLMLMIFVTWNDVARVVARVIGS